MTAGETDLEDFREEALRLLRGEGLVMAIRAAISIAGDTTAPAPARAASASMIIRASGLLTRDDDADAEPHEMTSQQLSRAARKAEAELARLGRADDVDIFD